MYSAILDRENRYGPCRKYTTREVQANKSTRRMPWHQEPKKDVTSCDKPRGAANKHYYPWISECGNTYGEEPYIIN